MSIKKKFVAIVALCAMGSLIAACSSSSSSSSGRGQIPTGQYAGNLNAQGRVNSSTGIPFSIQIILNVVAELDTSSSPGTVSISSGNLVVTGGDRCFTGGTINASASTTSTNTDTDTDTDTGTNSNAQNNQLNNQETDAMARVIEILISPAMAQSVINGDQMILEIAMNGGATLNMSGRVTDDSYSGTFNSSDSSCGAISGGFDLSRV